MTVDSTPFSYESRRKPYNELKPEKCPFCDNEYKDLNRHIDRIHKRIFNFPCPKCSEKFMYRSALNNHIGSKHRGSPTFLCYICGRSFFTPENLRLHEMTHREHDLVCDHCDSKFKSKSSLACHCRQHGDIRPYKCAYCNMGFRQTAPRKVHEIRKHTKKFPLLCQTCGQKFVFPNELKVHKRKKGCK